MKKRFLLFCFVFIFSFVMLSALCGTALTSFSQTAEADTHRIITLIDSCKALPDVPCGNNLLKLIQANLTEARNEKEKMFYQKAEIKTLRNIGNTYKNSLSDFPKAMEYYQLSRKKAEKIDDKVGIAAALLNIGIIYSDLSEYPKALEYQEKSLKMFREIGDERGIGICLNNLGNIYKNQSNYSKALDYFQNSLIIQQQRADTFEIMTCFNNMAYVYEKLSDFSKATAYFETGKKYAEKIKNADGVIKSLAGIGNILSSTGKQGEAEKYYKKVLLLATESGNLFIQSEAAKALRNIFQKKGFYKEALEMSDKHIVLRDSIFSQNKSKEIALRDAKYESDKREATIQAVAEEEKQRAKVIIWSVASGLLLVAVFAGFIFRSLRITSKQKNIIELQKEEVERQKKIVDEHQKEIIDSITYAKRLQDAILPPLDFIKKHLSDSFVLYKPKDIVAGDFYWMEIVDEKILFAAADCTGHGVAGSMLSVVCHNALNRTVKEFGFRDTGKILDKATELVLETFEKSDEDVKDGMDISLLSCKMADGSWQLEWSGANNPLWYIQNGELLEITADKQPIGKHDNRKPFTTHNIEISPKFKVPTSRFRESDSADLGYGTCFYLFTDGMADQFGGSKGKKFKYKQLEELLIANCQLSMEEQKKILEKKFEEWKGNFEQVDDVLVIGIKIEKNKW